MSKHTPGPWEAIGNLVRSPMVQPEGLPKGIQIAECRDPFFLPHTDESKANARLIAAAPLMLEALVRLCEAARALDEQISTVHDKIVITDAVSLLRLQNNALLAVKQAEAAIAAAKGEA